MQARRIFGVSAWIVLVAGVSAVWIAHAQQSNPPAAQAGADDPRFTGKSTTLDAKELGVSRRHFEPGARSAWHSHEKGQLIYVEEGRARTQKRGLPMRELAMGDSDYTGPNMEHWHGAAPNQPFVQAAVGFGGGIKWLDKVTDEEYAGRVTATVTPVAIAKDSRLFELRTYYAAAGRLADLHARFRNHTNKLFVKHGMTIVGFWEPTDRPDTLVYILAYKDRAARDTAWKAFGSDPDWIKARKESEVNGPLTTKIEAQFLGAADYSPIK